MSIATQITRLQGVRDQIRTKMVSLGLSENTDLLQNLADDRDGIAVATANDVSGSVSGDNPGKITLTAAKTLGSSSTTATASATITKGLYTGSSDITKSLTSKTITATAEAALAASVTGTDKIPNPLPPGTVEITPNTDNTKRIYSDSTNKGFITNVVLNAIASSSVSTGTDPGTSYTNKATVTPSKSNQYVKVTEGYLPNSKVTVNAIPSKTFTIAASAWSTMSPVNETGSYTCTITGVTGVTASNDVVVLPSNTSVVASCGVYASAQGASSITFKAFNRPSSDISYTVYILNS